MSIFKDEDIPAKLSREARIQQYMERADVLDEVANFLSHVTSEHTSKELEVKLKIVVRKKRSLARKLRQINESQRNTRRSS